MSLPPSNDTITTPITCTYVFRFDREDDNATPAETRAIIQSYLGSEHEVLSSSKLQFNTIDTDNSSIIHHVVKVKTCAPTDVATKLMGNAWVRQDHILFKTQPSDE
jgi:hypothetical protein